VSAAVAPLSAGTDAGANQSTRAVTQELKKLLLHSSHYLLGILISLGIGFVSFPIFTRVFSVSDYGTIDLVAKILLLFAALSKMGLQQSALRFYDGRLFSSDEAAKRRYYSTMFWGMALSAVCVTLLLQLGAGFALRAFLNRDSTKILPLIAILIVARALTSLLWVFVRVQERTKLYSFFTATTKVATLVAVCSFVPWLGRSVVTYYSGTAAVEIAIAIALSAVLLRGRLLSPTSFDASLFRAGLKLGLPLVFYELASIVLDASDRVLVRHYLGGDALGYYSVAYGMSDYVNNLLIVPINLALTPIYLKLWINAGQKSTSEFLSRALDLFFMGSAGIFALVKVTARDAVTMLASSKYHGADALIPMIVAGLLIYTSHAFLSAGLMIYKDTLTMAKVLGCSALLNIGLNWFLLPRLGLQAAALATLLSYLACIVMLGLASNRFLPLHVDLRALAKYVLAALVAWYGASRIELGSARANLACQVPLALVLYGGLLYLLDSRIRALPGHLGNLYRRPGRAVRKSRGPSIATDV
jgi:O-antigen/teichoic acid export membrane protein